MEFFYTADRDEEIVRHEETMIKEYGIIFDKYRALFEQYHCTLEVACQWDNILKKEYSTHRLPFENGYMCYIECKVLRNGRHVHIISDDGEADYYPLYASWTVSAIVRTIFFKLKVILCTDTEDVEEDLNRMLQTLYNAE